MKEDKKIVSLFLSGYAKETGAAFVRIDPLDEVVRDRPAVDAIAKDEFGTTVAVEHTILQPFPGQKESLSRQLKKVFEPLKRQAVPGRNICISVLHDSIKRGQDWARAAEAVSGWFERARTSFPLGWSHHIVIVPGLGLEVHLVGHCNIIRGQQGFVSFMYANPQMEEEFVEAVAESVKQKVSKLVKAKADRKILLLQREWLAPPYGRLGSVLDSLLPRFPELAQVDEIWLATTTFCEREGSVDFDRVRPAEPCSSGFFRTDCE